MLGKQFMFLMKGLGIKFVHVVNFTLITDSNISRLVDSFLSLFYPFPHYRYSPDVVCTMDQKCTKHPRK